MAAIDDVRLYCASCGLAVSYLVREAEHPRTGTNVSIRPCVPCAEKKALAMGECLINSIRDRAAKTFVSLLEAAHTSALESQGGKVKEKE